MSGSTLLVDVGLCSPLTAANDAHDAVAYIPSSLVIPITGLLLGVTATNYFPPFSPPVVYNFDLAIDADIHHFMGQVDVINPDLLTTPVVVPLRDFPSLGPPEPDSIVRLSPLPWDATS